MSINTQSTVVAVFSTAAEAESAANDLKANGFGSHNVFVSSGSPVSSGVTAHETELTEHEGGVNRFEDGSGGGRSPHSQGSHRTNGDGSRYAPRHRSGRREPSGGRCTRRFDKAGYC